MASRGHRVIACAQYLLPGDEYPSAYPFSRTDDQYPIGDYCFVGLVSLEDPPKHGVREAIGTLRLAGIKVMMVTGKHILRECLKTTLTILNIKVITPKRPKPSLARSTSSSETLAKHLRRKRTEPSKIFMRMKSLRWSFTEMI